jgi:kynurenine formamidase
MSKLVDLTHLLNESATVYPDTIGPKFEKINSVEEHGYAELKATMVLHSGTHIDAPCHIVANAASLDHYPLEKFIGKAIVIPCLNREVITLDYLKSFEPNLLQVDFVLLYTGWQDKWNSTAYFDNGPFLGKEAAEYLSNFKLKGLGIDAFSVDPIVSATVVNPDNLPNHYIFLEKDILLIENLCNLHLLPDTIFNFQCFPIKIEHADGSPIRAIAII